MIQTTTEQSLWLHSDGTGAIRVLDQRKLPHEVVECDIRSSEAVIRAIKEMIVRGAPLIGVTAAFGVFYACVEARNRWDPEAYIEERLRELTAARPTAVNLRWAVQRQREAIADFASPDEKAAVALAEAKTMMREDIITCGLIGDHGVDLIRQISETKGGPVNILTHCNAGRLGCIKWGTATAPVYKAFQQGLQVHVWVDETRPRNQGAGLTAWELGQAGIPHTVIVDNAGGHLMQNELVDLVIVGADRITATGDTANKVGTYLKALAARHNLIPFYVAAPYSTIDWALTNGREIPIEERCADEVRFVHGWDHGAWRRVLVTPADSPAVNYGFDITPASLITGFITEKGIKLRSASGFLF